jgi:hypothetical protein
MPSIMQEVIAIRAKVDKSYVLPKLYLALLEGIKSEKKNEQRKQVIRQFCKKELGLDSPVFFTPKYTPLPGLEKNRCHPNVAGSMIPRTAPQHCWKICLAPIFDMTPIPEAVGAVFHSVLRHDDGSFLEITPQPQKVDFYIVEDRFIFERTLRDQARRIDAWRKDKSVEISYKNYGTHAEPGPCIFEVQKIKL